MYGWTRQTKEAFSDGYDRGTGVMIAQFCVAANNGLIKIETPFGSGTKGLFKTFQKLDKKEVEDFFNEMVVARRNMNM